MEAVATKASLKTQICERLKEARMLAGFKTAKEFAEKKQLKVSTYSLHEAGTRSMSFEVIEHYADILEINTNWLLAGMEPRSKFKVRKVPIIEWCEASSFLDNPNQDFLKTTLSDTDLSPFSFGLVIQNDAMEPRYPEGSIILVDCEQRPQHKDYALIQLDAKQEPIFKQLMHVDGQVFAKSINPDYPTITLNSQAKILGKVIQAKLNC